MLSALSRCSLLRSLVSHAGQCDEIFVTHEISVLLPKYTNASSNVTVESSVNSLYDRPLGTRSHEGNQNPQFIGRTSLTKK
ncbi:hypothetical protein JPSP49_01630 [Staphylococcus pseudintermedius]